MLKQPSLQSLSSSSHPIAVNVHQHQQQEAAASEDEGSIIIKGNDTETPSLRISAPQPSTIHFPKRQLSTSPSAHLNDDNDGNQNP